MPEVPVGSWWIFVLAGALLLALALPLWRILLVYRDAPSRRPFDASSLGLRPPPHIEPLMGGLVRLGFRRLGEAQIVLPGSSAGVPFGRSRAAVFVLVDGDGTVVAEMTDLPGIKPVVSLSSAFADGTVVETMYPIGESIDDGDFHSGHNRQSLDAAYDDQRVQMNRWRMRHGSPRVFSTMSDYLTADAEYRDRFAKRKLRGPLIRKQILPTVLIAAVVIIGSVVLLNWTR